VDLEGIGSLALVIDVPAVPLELVEELLSVRVGGRTKVDPFDEIWHAAYDRGNLSTTDVSRLQRLERPEVPTSRKV
jgi:hypothetical protein